MILYVLIFTFLAWAYCFTCGNVSDDNDKFDRMPKTTWKDALWTTSIVHEGINKILWIIFKKKHWGWFSFNITLHLVNTYLLYVCALLFFPEKIALIAAMIFGVHTANHQGVAWVSGAGYSLCATFCLLAVMFGQNQCAFFALWLLAISSFLGAATLPIIMAILYQQPMYLLYLLLGVVFLIYKFKTRFKLLQARSRYFMPYPARINMLIKVLAYYFFMGTFPVKMGWYHEIGFDYNPKLDKTDWISVVCLTSLVVIFATAYHYGLVIPLLWFVLALIPSMNIIFCNSLVAERYIYVPMLGLSVFFATVISLLPYSSIITAVYIGFLLVHTIQCCRSYRSNIELYKYNSLKHPSSSYAINNYGFYFLAKHRPDIAINYFRQAIKLEPNNKFSWHSLGNCYALINTEIMANCPKCGMNFKTMDAGNFWKSVMAMNQSIKISPNWDVPQKNLKEVIGHMKRIGILKEERVEGEHGQAHTTFSPPSQRPDPGVQRRAKNKKADS